MKFVMMGSLDKQAVKELRGQPCIVIVGTVDEVRGMAPMLFSDVTVTASEAPSVDQEKKT